MKNKIILTEKEIRNKFLDFFASKGHEIAIYLQKIKYQFMEHTTKINLLLKTKKNLTLTKMKY